MVPFGVTGRAPKAIEAFVTASIWSYRFVSWVLDW